MKNLENKVIVITGASSGIGRATALEVARNYGTVILVARRRAVLEDLAEECKSIGGKAMAWPTDVCKEKELSSLVDKVMDSYGKIDVWINNAAITLMGPFEETPLQDSRQVLETNVMGYMNGAHAVLPVFREQGYGILINVSSMVAITGQPFSVAYSASKFAIRGMSLSLEQELSDVENIHICSVLPSVIDTPIFQSAGNYMGRKVKAPEPVIPAQDVADAIIGLIHHPKKEIVVGNLGRASKFMRMLSPALYDRQNRKKILNDHFQDEASSTSTGNLYNPNGKGSISGGWLPPSPTGPALDGRQLGIGLAAAGLLAGAIVILKQKT